MKGKASHRLRERVAFDPPMLDADGYGGVETAWDTENTYECSADFLFLRGGETVQAARLEGRQPVVVSIRACTAARAITPAWRMRDRRSGMIYNIRAIVPTDDRKWIEITAESGVAI